LITLFVYPLKLLEIILYIMPITTAEEDLKAILG
jgi:hypothetical protein